MQKEVEEVPGARSPGVRAAGAGRGALSLVVEREGFWA